MKKNTTSTECGAAYVAPLCTEYEIRVPQVICTSGDTEQVIDTYGEW